MSSNLLTSLVSIFLVFMSFYSCILVVTVSLPSTTLSVHEDIGNLTVCVTLSGRNSRDFSVILTTNDLTGEKISIHVMSLSIHSSSAFAGHDYTGASMTLTMPAGSTSGVVKCMNISIIDDGALEVIETFTVTLTTTDPDVMLGKNKTVVTIMDDDGNSFLMLIVISICLCAEVKFPSHLMYRVKYVLVLFFNC